MGDARANSRFNAVLVASGLFFLSYTCIHIWLNLTDQGTRDFGEAWYSTSFANVLVEMSGPTTISVCSSLLILVYGAFLLNGLDQLSIADPMVFLDAFLIFIVGQILVQVAGHSEIALNNALLANDDPPMWLDLASLFTYPVLFGSLYFLERYEDRVYENLKEKFPDVKWKESKGGSGGWLTIFTIAMLLAKGLIVFFLADHAKTQNDDTSKAMLIALSLAMEVAIVSYIVFIQYRRSRFTPTEAES
jgi:hypothetical protein